MQYTRLNGAGPFACWRHKEEKEGEGETDSLAVAAAAGKKAIVEMRLTDRSTAVITHLQ